jgi:uncharacterized Rossmann fold enzyme
VLNVACVKWGKKYSPEYVNILYDSVRRNLAYGLVGRFVCFTDDPTGLEAGIETRLLPEGLEGWWNKLYLFSKEAFQDGDRVLYFDLDTAITGPIDFMADYRGEFAILRDAYRLDGLQSSVLAWEAGNWTRLLWERWPDYKHLPWPGGDQQYIEAQLFGSSGQFTYEKWQNRFPGRFCSYKVQARNEIPKGCSVVFFHGNPRPHEVKDGWVPHVWKVGGGSGAEFIVQSNVSNERLEWNVALALKSCKTWLKKEPGHSGVAVIVGGGPSLKDHLFRVRGRQMAKAKVFACGNAANYLLENQITPDYQILLDARAENAFFVVPDPTVKFIASQCDPRTWKKGGIGFHAMQTSYMHLIEHEEMLVGGGSTVGLKAIAIAYALGFRNFHLFGFDSSYSEDSHHAYPQSLNDKERRMEVKCGGKTFTCAPWMVTQAEEFKELARVLVEMGCTFSIHGEGLIPSIAAALEVPLVAADTRAHEILKHLNGQKDPVGVEVGVFAGALSVRLLSHPKLILHMVDSWTSEGVTQEQIDSGDFHAKLSQAQQDHLYSTTKETVAFAGERARVIRAESVKAASEFEDESVDFVFIDANHLYEAVKEDIEAWWPKVRPGGFLSGHDYENPEYPLWGVKRAVDERFGKRVTLGENFCWFVHKAGTYEH